MFDQNDLKLNNIKRTYIYTQTLYFRDNFFWGMDWSLQPKQGKSTRPAPIKFFPLIIKILKSITAKKRILLSGAFIMIKIMKLMADATKGKMMKGTGIKESFR